VLSIPAQAALALSAAYPVVFDHLPTKKRECQARGGLHPLSQKLFSKENRASKRGFTPLSLISPSQT